MDLNNFVTCPQRINQQLFSLKCETSSGYTLTESETASLTKYPVFKVTITVKQLSLELLYDWHLRQRAMKYKPTNHFIFLIHTQRITKKAVKKEYVTSILDFSLPFRLPIHCGIS